MAALLGRRCGTNSWDCLLPELTLIAAPSDTFDPDVVVRRPGILGLLAGREGRPALASPQYGLNLEDGWGGLDQAFDIGGFGFGATSSGGGITVDGALAQDIIRRIVRAHTDEVRDCYAQGLDKDPDLHGRLKIAFEIAASGAVTSSTIKDSTLGEDGVGECIVQAVKRWKFPKPTGAGVVSVVYPFVLVSR
ncbi:MAG: AgmX/PglI C-terminal domain-containing protein [Nannocystaceae bacterium]|nr:AgmX/PglI C-terminal domain-containing protein [Nannocystaceae bacterium]